MKSWEKEIEKISEDSVNGATFLTKKAVEIVKNIENSEDLHSALKLLKTVQPMMASIYNFALFIENNMDKDIKKLCDKWWEDFEKSNEKVIKKAARLLENRTILTHSFSSLVYKSIIDSKNVKVYCTVSEPKREGTQLAKKLCENGIDTTLVTDAAAPHFVNEVDMVVFGADGVGGFGLVHKVGSYPIALAAKNQNKKVCSLAPKTKFWPKKFKKPPIDLKDPSEIGKGCFKVKNIYFDITPIYLIDLFITD